MKFTKKEKENASKLIAMLKAVLPELIAELKAKGVKYDKDTEDTFVDPFWTTINQFHPENHQDWATSTEPIPLDVPGEDTWMDWSGLQVDARENGFPKKAALILDLIQYNFGDDSAAKWGVGA